jgi:FMN phosphatase YigB (HAD superfamily)
MSEIQFVYFDLGGVLFNWKNAYRKLAVYVNRPYDDVFTILKKYDDDLCRGKIPPDQLINYYQNELHIDIALNDFNTLISKNYTPILPMHKLLREVTKKYHVGILTNLYSGVWEYCVHNGYVPDIPYKTIIQSCELSLVKPEEKFFLHAQKIAGVPPSKILFIDDMKKNLDKAKECSIV